MMDLLTTQQPENPALAVGSEIRIAMTPEAFAERVASIKERLSTLSRAHEMTRYRNVLDEIKRDLEEARDCDDPEEAGAIALGVLNRLPSLHAASATLGRAQIGLRELWKFWKARLLAELWDEIRDAAAAEFAPVVAAREAKERGFADEVGDPFRPGDGLRAMGERLDAIRRSRVLGFGSFTKRFRSLGIVLADGSVPEMPTEGEDDGDA